MRNGDPDTCHFSISADPYARLGPQFALTSRNSDFLKRPDDAILEQLDVLSTPKPLSVREIMG